MTNQESERANYCRCSECSWISPRTAWLFGHNEASCPKCGKESAIELHKATKVLPVVDVTKLTCLTCGRFGEQCNGQNCAVLPTGIQFWEKMMRLVIKDGFVKAWWDV